MTFLWRSLPFIKRNYQTNLLAWLSSWRPADTRLLRLFFFCDGVFGISSGSALKSLKKMRERERCMLTKKKSLARIYLADLHCNKVSLPREHAICFLLYLFEPHHVDIFNLIDEFLRLSHKHLRKGAHWRQHGVHGGSCREKVEWLLNCSLDRICFHRMWALLH